MKYYQHLLLQRLKYQKIDVNRSAIIILLIILIPTVIVISTTFFLLTIAQNISLENIDTFAEQLYRDQITSSQTQNGALVFQLNQQVQKISWEMNILSEYVQSILNGDVIPNTQYIPTYHNILRTYYDQEDPAILALYHKNEMLTNSWHLVNQSRVEEFDERQKTQMSRAIRTDPFMRAFKYESINSKTRQFKIKDIYIAHSYDGLSYITSTNTTNEKYIPPPDCPYHGIYKLDVRCRFYYGSTIKNVSIVIYDPQPFFTNGKQNFVSAFCKRILQYEKKDPNSPSSVYAVLCYTLDLRVIPEYFSILASSTSYQIFLDPRKLTIVYHSQAQLPKTRIATVQEFETKYLENQEQAKKFFDNINSFQKYVLESIDNIKNVGFLTDIARKTFEYKRNGTDCFVIINLITMIDKLPRYEYLRAQNPSHRYEVKGSFLFLDILSKKLMTQYSDDLKQKIKHFNSYFNYISWGIAVLVLGFQIYYSFVLGNNLMHPVIHLTKLLKSIRFLNKNSQDLPERSYKINNQDKSGNNQIEEVKSEIYTEQNCVIQFDENFDNVNFDGICFSSDTQVLLNSFQNLFKILRFTTHNFYNENNSVSLLNLNIQIQHFDSFGNYGALGVCHNNIGVIHYNCGRFHEAVQSFQKAIIYAKYELNLYSHDINEISYQINSIKKNSDFMRNNLMQNTNIVESFNTKFGTQSDFERQQNKQGENVKVQKQMNAEKEQLYWNLYNRNQNYGKALASYFCFEANACSNLWDLFSDIAIENASISQLYLPQSNKREMLDCFFLLTGSFKQNLFDETSYLLTRFSNLYIQHFQQKNYTPFDTLESHDLNNSNLHQKIYFLNNINQSIYNNNIQNSNQPHKNNQNFNNPSQMSQFINLQSQNCFNMNDSSIHSSQRHSQIANSSLLLTPLSKPKSKQRNQSQSLQLFHRFKQIYSSPQHFSSFKNQDSTIDNTYSNQHNFFVRQFNLSGEQSQFQHNKQQIQQLERDNNKGQCQENQNSPSQKTLQFKNQMGIQVDIQNNHQGRKIPQNSENNQVNKLKQSQYVEIYRQNSQDYNKQQPTFSQNQNSQNYFTQKIKHLSQSKNLINNILKNETQDQIEENSFLTLSPKVKILGGKLNSIAQVNQKDMSNNLPQLSQYTKRLLNKTNDPLSNILSDHRQSIADSIILQSNLSNNNNENNNSENRKEQQYQLSLSAKPITEKNIKRQQSNINVAKKKNLFEKIKNSIKNEGISEKQINKNENIAKNKKQKIKNYYVVRKIEKNEKLSMYEFSSDIYFQFYALRQAQFQINCKNYLNASLILTNILEQCKYYLPHLKMQILSTLSSIFKSQKVYSPELDEMNQNYQKMLNLNSTICVISSCSTINSQIKTFQICNDIINQILFKNNDCFGLMKYSFKEGIYLQSMGLTNIQTIKSAPQFFERIITPNYMRNDFFSIQKNLKAKFNEQQKQANDRKSIPQNYGKPQNFHDSTVLSKSQINDNKCQTQEQNSDQSNIQLLVRKGDNCREFASNVQEIKELNAHINSSSFDTELTKTEESNFWYNENYTMNISQNICKPQNKQIGLNFQVESHQLSFNEQKDYSGPINFNIKMPISQKQKEDIKNEQKNKKDGQEIFHQGVHAALKQFILNSDEKLSCYLSKNLFKKRQNSHQITHNSQKTYLVYITNQILILNHKQLLTQLCEMLCNLDIELLVLVLNPYQTFEEFSSLQNIFLNKKSVISFFQSEEKLLQYIYNMREHVKNNIAPIVVEHF